MTEKIINTRSALEIVYEILFHAAHLISTQIDSGRIWRNEIILQSIHFNVLNNGRPVPVNLANGGINDISQISYGNSGFVSLESYCHRTDIESPCGTARAWIAAAI